MKNQNIYVDINLVQTVPSANINRDDAGSPKTAIYGGVLRSRVSSQSWKRAARLGFDKQGLRTKRLPQLLSKKLQELKNDLTVEEANKKVEEILKAGGIKIDKKTFETKTLLFVSPWQVQKIAEFSLENEKMDKNDFKEKFNEGNSLDIALFGRMVAENPELNVEAAAQVAHAISTHKITPEYDYFTAVDDGKEADESGAGMLGTVEYNSSTLYRYANVNMRELNENLGQDDAIAGVLEFIKTFVMSMPNGKQNSFANKTIPQYVMVTLRPDTPVNLVSAFEEPVKATESGYAVKSIQKLEEEFNNTQKFVAKPLETFVLTTKNSILDKNVESLQELLDGVKESLTEVLSDESIND